MIYTSSQYLLDASAIYPLVLRLRKKFLEYADRFTVLDLTIYEVGNALWKEYRLGRIRDLATVAKLFEFILGSIRVLRLGSEIHNVLDLAVSENLTFYDASYLYMARVHGMKLVTEDQSLLRYPEAVNTEKLLQELQTM